MMKPIYLDAPASTPLDPRVVEILHQSHSANFGNPHASNHVFGWQAEEAIESVKLSIAKWLSVPSHSHSISTHLLVRSQEIIFTSGATESNNIALLGFAHGIAEHDHNYPIIIASQLEHESVLAPVQHLATKGFSLLLLPVTHAGVIDINALPEWIEQQAILNRLMPNQKIILTLQAVNNELGTIQPLVETLAIFTAAFSRDRLIFHIDATQASARIVVDAPKWGADSLSISAHKFYGPKGIGLLLVKDSQRDLIKPILFGGGQQRGLRPGTLATPLILGLGKAVEITSRELTENQHQVQRLSDKFIQQLATYKIAFAINGKDAPRVAGIINLRFANLEARQLAAAIPHIAIGLGSACKQATDHASPLLLAIGLNEAEARASIRIGINKFNTETEITSAAEQIAKAVLILQ